MHTHSNFSITSIIGCFFCLPGNMLQFLEAQTCYLHQKKGRARNIIRRARAITEACMAHDITSHEELALRRQARKRRQQNDAQKQS